MSLSMSPASTCAGTSEACSESGTSSSSGSTEAPFGPSSVVRLDALALRAQWVQYRQIQKEARHANGSCFVLSLTVFRALLPKYRSPSGNLRPAAERGG